MRTKKQFISLMLMLALLLGMIPGVAVSALAEEIEIEGDSQEELPTEVEFDLAAPALRTGATERPTGTVKEEYLGIATEDLPASTDDPVETDISKLNGSNWMAGIRGDAYLNDFNIPYTHDAAMKDYIYHWGTQSSGNFFGQGSYAKTQYLYIPQQLEAGVRILDLRLNNRYETRDWLLGEYYQKDDGENLYLCHGKNSSGGTFWAEDSDGDWVTFERVLKYVKDFLTKHPTETVILELSIETQDNDKYGDIVAERAANHLMYYLWDINPSTQMPYLYQEGQRELDWGGYYHNYGFTNYTHMPQLKDCRGQALIMYQAHQFKGKVGGMKRSIVGDVDILGGSNSASASDKYEALVNEYEADGPNDLTLPMPGEHRDLLRIVDTNSHADEFWDYVFVAIDDMHPLEIADYVHPKVFGEGKLLSIVGKYYGWVKMDGATERDCRYIWKTNFPSYNFHTLTVAPGDASDETNAAYYADYETKTYKVVAGQHIDLTGDIYEPRQYSDKTKGVIPWLDKWIVKDTQSGEVLGTYDVFDQAASLVVPDRDVTLIPVYRDVGKIFFFDVIWQDGNDKDGIRPNKLNVSVTYKDRNGQIAEGNVTVPETLRHYLYNGYKHDYSWKGYFIGDMKSFEGIGINTPGDQGIDGEGTYRYEITGTPGETDLTIKMIHTPINNTTTVSDVVRWEDRDDADHVRPDSVTLRLYANGKNTGKSVTVTPTIFKDDDGNESQIWSWEIPDCQYSEEGVIIQYSVREDAIVVADPDNIGIEGYEASINGTSVLNWHWTTRESNTIQVHWDDVGYESVRPNPVYVNLYARKDDTQEYSLIERREVYKPNGLDRYDSDSTTITLYGVDNLGLQYKVTQDPLENYVTTVEYDKKNSVGQPFIQVTNRRVPDVKPSALEGVYKCGYTTDSETVYGDIIGFGQGTYITDANNAPILMTGNREVTWVGYADGKHHFTLGEQDIYLADVDDSTPWGISVTGGSGTEAKPYTFIALHREAVSYWVGSESGSFTQKYCKDYELVKCKIEDPEKNYETIQTETTKLESGKWYVVDSYTAKEVISSDGISYWNYGYMTHDTVKLENRLVVEPGEEVHLILRNGKELLALAGIEVGEGATLHIHQENLGGSGSLTTFVSGTPATQKNGSGIGANSGKTGTIVIHGGVIHAYSFGNGDAAIGGGNGSTAGGTLTVYGGRVYAQALADAATPAIGGIENINVYGGAVTAEATGNGSTIKAIQGGEITLGTGLAVYDGLYYDGVQPDKEKTIEAYNDAENRTKEMSIRVGHYHDFVYSDSNTPVIGDAEPIPENTVIATCISDGECSLEGRKATLTLTAPTLTVYGGEGNANATATVVDGNGQPTTDGLGNPTIKYYALNADGTFASLSEAPVILGAYKAEVEYRGVTVSTETVGTGDDAYVKKYTGNAKATVYYIIGAGIVEIATPPTASEITYGATLGDEKNGSTLTGGVAKFGDTEIEGTFAWENPDIEPKVSDSETTEYTVIFTPDDTELYQTATCVVKVKVNPAEQTVTAPQGLTKTYNGRPQALVIDGTADRGVMKYALGDTAPDAATVDDWQYTVPAATDAGEYKVWYKVFSGDANYSDTEPASVTAKIEKADSSGTVTGIENLVYNTAEQALVTPGEHVGGELQYFVGDDAPTDESQWSDAVATGKNAGTYKVFYRVKGDENHNNYIAPEPVEVIIAKAVVKVSKPPVASAITYGQKLENSTLTGGEVEPSVPGYFAWTDDTIKPAVADSGTAQYEVTFVPQDNDNYRAEADKSYATVVVVPADPTVTPPAAISPLVYTGAAQDLITEGSAEHGTMMYALGKTAPADKAEWSESVPTGTEAGDYIVWYKVFGDTNYNDAGAAPLYVTIYPAQSGAVTPDTLVYNGEAQKLVVPGTVVGGTLQYFVGDAAPTDASQWKDDIPTRTDAGDYKVWYRVKGDANHNDGEPGSVTATIAKAPITPGVSITGWTYGEAANDPAVTGNPGNGEVTVTYSAEKEGAYTTAVPTQAGSWFVKAEVAETKNYQAGTAYPVSFAIAKVNVSIFADNQSGVYGDALQTLTWRMGGETVNGDDLGVTLTTTAKADSAPGDYPITVKWGEDSNYNATVVDGVYTVGKRPVTVAAADQTIRSGEQIAIGVDHATATGLAEGHVLSAVTLAADGSAIKASGAKIVDAAGADVTTNYAVSYAAGKLNVQQPGTPVVFPPTAKELTYNGKAQALVSAGKAEGGTMQYSADNKTWSENIPTGTDAGDYTVYYRVKGDADHSDVAASSLKATIAKASIAPVVTITGWTYGDKANAPALKGNPGKGEVTYLYGAEKDGAYTKTVPTQAGSWFVKAKVAETSNYESGTANPVGFAIAKVSVSIFADNKSGVYGDALQTLTWRLGGKTVNGDDLGISLTTTAKADSAPGDYPITVKWNGNKNYSAIVKDGVYTIGKRHVTVAAGDQTIRSGGKIATGVDHATATGLAKGHKLSAVTLAASGSAIKASGAKIVDAKGKDVTANYAVSYAAGKLNVLEPGTPAVFPPAARELTYNGKAQALVSAGKAEGGTMQYSLDKKTWSKKLPTGTDAGDYTVYYRVKGDADHGDVAASSLKVTIAKAAPKVTAPTAEKLTYTGNAQALVSTGEVEGGKLLYSKDNKTWSEKIPTGTKAGRYNVFYKVEGDKNHSDAAAKRVKVTIAERKASPDYTLLAKMTTSGSTRLKLSWSKVKGAQGYDVFFKNCDGKENYTRVTITSKRSYTITGLKKRKAYKAYVVAWKKSGDRKYYIGDASPIVHAITGGYTSEQCNAKSVELSKSSLTLKVGKSETLKTSVKGVKSGRKVLRHAKLVRYYSSDANVAKVNENGKITAVGKGSCTVYAVANNGMRSKVTVKVN